MFSEETTTPVHKMSGGSIYHVTANFIGPQHCFGDSHWLEIQEVKIIQKSSCYFYFFFQCINLFTSFRNLGFLALRERKPPPWYLFKGLGFFISTI